MLTAFLVGCGPAVLMGCGPAPWRLNHLRNEFTVITPRASASVEQHPNGLADASLTLETDLKRIILYGFEFHDADRRKLVPDRTVFTPVGPKLIVEHHFDPGRVVTATLRLHETGLLTCTFERLDRIGHVTSGRVDTSFETILFDYGWVLKNPGRFRRNRVMSDFLIGSDPEGGHTLIACDQGTRTLIDPEARRYAWQTRHRPPKATFILGIDDRLDELIARYKTVRGHQRGPHADKLVGRLLIDDWSGHEFAYLPSLLATLRFANADRLLHVRHIWQRYGYDVKLPDTYPPSEAYGGLEGMSELADYCRRHKIIFALHENFFDLYEDAPSFSSFTAARQPRAWTGGAPVPYTGWTNPETGQQARLHTPDSALSAMKRNLTWQEANLKASAAFLDVTSYSDPLALDGQPAQTQPSAATRPTVTTRPAGASQRAASVPAGGPAATQPDAAPADSLITLRRLHADAAKIVQGPVLGEGCTEKYLGVVDGANLDLWSHDRWGSDPGAEDWEFSPALAWVAHASVVFQGAGYRHRYARPQQVRLTAGMYTEPFTDDYQSSVILFGSAPVSLLDDPPYATRVSRILKDYYLGVPFHRQVGLVAITNVEHPDGDPHRAIVTYANATKVYVNRSEDDWNVEDFVLPQFGYAVRHESFTQLAVRHAGHRLDLVLAPDVYYVDTRGVKRIFAGMTFSGSLAVCLFPDRCEIVPIADVESIHLDFAHLPIPAERIDRVDVVAPDGSVSALVGDRADELVVPAESFRRAADPEALFSFEYNKIVVRRKGPRPADEPIRRPAMPVRPADAPVPAGS